MFRDVLAAFCLECWHLIVLLTSSCLQPAKGDLHRRCCMYVDHMCVYIYIYNSNNSNNNSNYNDDNSNNRNI